MSLLSNAINCNSSASQQSCCFTVRSGLKQCCQRICCIFTHCLSKDRDSSATEIPLSEIGFSRLEESINSRKVAEIFSVKYAQKKLTASEKLKKQLLYALKDPNQKIKAERNPFVFPNLRPKTKPAVYTPFGFAIAQRRGSRDEQEDGFLKQFKVNFVWKGMKLQALLFGVFDGHGDGGDVSHHLNQSLIPSLENLLTKAQNEYEDLGDEVISNAFTQVFHDLSKSYQTEWGNRGGAVATCAFAIGNVIYIPNVGDSRTILIKPDCTLPLTEDGIADNRRFKKWHLDRGYRIFPDHMGTHRIWGNGISGAMYARDIGNPAMCSRPKITKITIGDGVDNLDEGIIFCKKGDFLLLASDGLWEAATTEEIGKVVRKFVQMGFPLEEIATQIASKAGSLPKNDNVTVKIIAI